jgi:hypothetical protein
LLSLGWNAECIGRYPKLEEKVNLLRWTELFTLILLVGVMVAVVTVTGQKSRSLTLTTLGVAEASIKDIPEATQVNRDQLTNTSVNVDTNKPGALARYEVRFTTGAMLQNGIDTIVLRFAKDFQVPPSVDRNNVSLSATAVTGGTGLPKVSVSPLAVTVDFIGPKNDEPEISITVPDMDPGDNTGGNGIASGATVTVIFSHSAGIRNPTQGSEGGYEVNISSSRETNPVTDSVVIPFMVGLSSTADPGNTEVTLVGRGFLNGTTTTFWRDANGNGIRDAGEPDLCSGLASDDDVANCNFTVTNPPFAPGFGSDCILNTDGDSLENCNFINARDGRNNTSTIATQADVDAQTYQLEGQVTATPDSGKPGDTITIQLRDFPQGTVTDVSVGGVAIAGVNHTVPASGKVSFTIDIPNGLPPGVQALVVREPVTNETRQANITIEE